MLASTSPSIPPPQPRERLEPPGRGLEIANAIGDIGGDDVAISDSVHLPLEMAVAEAGEKYIQRRLQVANTAMSGRNGGNWNLPYFTHLLPRKKTSPWQVFPWSHFVALGTKRKAE